VKQTTKKLVEAAAVAERLGVTRDTVHEYVKQGLIPHVRLNTRTIRFEPEAIERWIEAATSGPAVHATKTEEVRISVVEREAIMRNAMSHMRLGCSSDWPYVFDTFYDLAEWMTCSPQGRSKPWLWTVYEEYLFLSVEEVLNERHPRPTPPVSSAL
jgi:excisionase family DNA binding protein